MHLNNNNIKSYEEIQFKFDFSSISLILEPIIYLLSVVQLIVMFYLLVICNRVILWLMINSV
jgi:hypothetical protein